MWQKSCDPQGLCWVEQFAISKPNKLVVLHIRFDAQPGDTARMIVTAPLGVALRPGLTVALDGAAAFDLPFERCGERGCGATAVLDKAALKNSSRARP